MITVLFHMVVKPDREQDFLKLSGELMSSTRAEDKGCIQYGIYRRNDTARQYVLIEQWENQEALLAHITRLQRVLGPPPDGARLPKQLLDHFESFEAVFYTASVVGHRPRA